MKKLPFDLEDINNDFLSNFQIHYDPSDGYDLMTQSEQYCLYDIEHLIEFYGRKSTFDIRDEKYK